MRFACQSCGKAYNLPEEKIADKSNVKLKCRVCGAIVEVKRQGEVVAQLLEEVDDAKRVRVSEAPAPLMSLSSDEADDATQAIAVGDQILGESSSPDDAASALLGHVQSALGQRGLGPLPPPPPTGFGSTPLTGFGSPPPSTAFNPPPPPPLGTTTPAFGSPPAFGASSPSFGGTAPFGATPVPPPLSVPEPAGFGRAEPPIAPPLPPPGAVPGFPSAGSPPPPPPPLPNLAAEAPLQNGTSNGLSARFADVVPLPPDEPPLPLAPVATSVGTGDASGFGGLSAPPVPQSGGTSDDTTRKILAALATGILIGFILARLFT